LAGEQGDRLRIGGWVRDPEVARLMPHPQPTGPHEPHVDSQLNAGSAASTAWTEADGLAHAGDLPAPAEGWLRRTLPRHAADSRRTGDPLRRWLIASVAMVLGGMVVTASLLLLPPGAPPGNATTDLPGTGLPETGLPGTGLPGPPLVAGSASTPAPAASPDPSAKPVSPTQSPTPAKSASRSPSPPAFAPLEIQAEDRRNSLGGSAYIRTIPDASGGAATANLGAGWDSDRPGTLTVPVTVPSTGRYTVSFQYLHPNGDPTRTVVITVSGAAPVAMTLSASENCCATATLEVTLRAGGNTITFGNPNGPASAIDRMLVTR
jgi:carbohydrate binding protein with CBM35 domain